MILEQLFIKCNTPHSFYYFVNDRELIKKLIYFIMYTSTYKYRTKVHVQNDLTNKE